MHHELHPVDVGIGLGSHDPTVPEVTVDLFNQGMFPYIVFTGANAPTTIERYPRGEAVHYGEYAVERGVPNHLVLLEKSARYTAENITFTRAMLAAEGRHPASVILISRPYQQRRAFAICQKLWPEVVPLCASTPLTFRKYVNVIGDVDRVVNMMVGDFARLTTDADRGIAAPMTIPNRLQSSFDRLRKAGFSARL
jgi:hypothetical protein